MKVLVGSKNPLKIAGTKNAFEKYYTDVEVEGLTIKDAPEMPFGDETLQGARHRAQTLRERGDADFYVGLEGGVVKHGGHMFCFNITVVLDNEGREGVGFSPHFMLPPRIAEALQQGKSLGEVMDAVTGKKNMKQKGGACGYFTKGVYVREDQHLSSTIMALAPFQHDRAYFP